MPDKELSGRDLDFAVAERVMDFSWRLFPNGRSLVPHKTAPLAKEDDPIHPNSGSQVPRYSVLISATMEVVEKMRGDYAWDIESWSTPAFARWHVQLWKDGDIQGDAKSASLPEAICRAALAAIESQHNTD